MRLIFLGPPGGGKGTHAKILSEKWKIPHLAAGDILRRHIREATSVGKKAKAIIERGELVPDAVINEIMADQLARPKAGRGFILDGYPRTLGQAKALEKFLEGRHEALDGAFYFKTSSRVILERLSGRLTCPTCGANYHVKNIPPKVAGKCDRCGTALIQRKDDQPETVLHRLAVYETETAPLLNYYEKRGILVEVPGDLEVVALQEVLAKILEKYNQHT